MPRIDQLPVVATTIVGTDTFVVLRSGIVSRVAFTLFPEGGGGATTFLGLTDTLNDYTGLASNFLRINAIEDSIEARTPGQALSDIGAAAASHSHAIADVTGLQTALDGKAATAHTHAAADVTSGTFDVLRIPNLDAGKIITGVFADARIPSLDSSKVTTGIFGVARGGTGLGTLTTNSFLRASSTSTFEQRTPAQVLTDIGASAASHSHAIADVTGLQTALDGKAAASHSHDASDVTSGTLDVLRIPNLDAGKITSGAFNDARIPSLDAGKITGGTFDPARIALATNLNYVRRSGAGVLEQRTPAQVLSDIGASAASHSHAIADVTGLQTALDGKAPTSHSHAIADVTGLQTALDGKAASSHTHAAGDVTSGVFSDTLIPNLDAGKIATGTFDAARIPSLDASKITTGIFGVARGGTGLGTLTTNSFLRASSTSTFEQRTPAQVLSDIGASAASHSHAIADVTGLQTALDGKAPTSHSHAIADVTGLQTALDGKAASSHTHAATDITSGFLNNDRLSEIPVAKISMNTARLLGRSTAGVGVAEEITVGSGLSLSGGILASTGGTGDGDVVGPASSVNSNFAFFDGITGKILKDSGLGASDFYPSNNPSGYLDSTDDRLYDEREWTADTVSQIEAETGTATTRRAWTAQRVAQAIAALAGPGGGLVAADIDTLAELNAILTDATLIDTGDSRLSDARTPTAHVHPASDVTSGTFDPARIALATNLNYVRRSGAGILEQRTPAQVLTDIGASAASHSHAIADVTGLQTALDGKAASSHTHAAGDVTSGTFDVLRIPDLDSAKITTGIFAVARGGTGLGTLTTNSFIRAASTSTFEQRTPAQVLSDIGAAAASHSHAIADITGLQTALDGKAPTSHSHAIADVTGLQTALDGKAASSHTHAATDITSGFLSNDRLSEIPVAKISMSTSRLLGRSTAGAGAVEEIVVGSGLSLSGGVLTATGDSGSSTFVGLDDTFAAFTGRGLDFLRVNSLEDAIESRTPAQVLSDIGAAAASHSHAIADVTGLQTALDGKAASSHSHAIADVTGLQTALDGKAASSHTHAAADVTGGTFDPARIAIATNLNYVRRSGAGVLEQRTPVQVLSDIGAAAASHTHAIADVTGLQTALDGKAASSHTHAAGDVTSGTFDVLRIPNLSASKITSDILAVARGGTGIGSYTTGNYIRASGATTLEQRTAAQARTDLGADDASNLITGTLPNDRLAQIPVAKLEMATARLLGRWTAATGAVEEVTVGTGLLLSAGVLSATGDGGGGGTSTGHAQTIGDGVATSILVTHNLGTYDVQVEVFENSGVRSTELVDVERTSIDSITLVFATGAPLTDSLRVVVTKAGVSNNITIINEVGITLALNAANASSPAHPRYIRCSNIAAITATLQAGLWAGEGLMWYIRAVNIGDITLSSLNSAAGAVVINGDPTTSGQNTTMTIMLVADDTVDTEGGVA